MNTSLEINLQSIIVDALTLEKEFLKGRACYHTGDILTHNGFKPAGAGFTFSFSRPISVPIPDAVDDAKTTMLNIEVGLPTPENDFEYAIRINFPVGIQLDEDDRGKCGILKVISNRVSFVPYTRFNSIRNNDSEDAFFDYAPTTGGELVDTDQDNVCLVVNNRGMTFNPRILEDIMVVFRDDDILWDELKALTQERV